MYYVVFPCFSCSWLFQNLIIGLCTSFLQKNERSVKEIWLYSVFAFQAAEKHFNSLFLFSLLETCTFYILVCKIWLVVFLQTGLITAAPTHPKVSWKLLLVERHLKEMYLLPLLNNSHPLLCLQRSMIQMKNLHRLKTIRRLKRSWICFLRLIATCVIQFHLIVSSCPANIVKEVCRTCRGREGGGVSYL